MSETLPMDHTYCMDDYQAPPKTDEEWDAWFSKLRETATKWWGADFKPTMQITRRLDPEYPRLKQIGERHGIRVVVSTFREPKA